MDTVITNETTLKSEFLRKGALNKIENNINELKANLGDTHIEHYQPSDGDIKLIQDSIEIGLKDLTYEKKKRILRMDLAGAGGGAPAVLKNQGRLLQVNYPQLNIYTRKFLGRFQTIFITLSVMKFPQLKH